MQSLDVVQNCYSTPFFAFPPPPPPARRAWSQGVAGLIENDNIILTTCIEKIERYLLKIRLNVY